MELFTKVVAINPALAGQAVRLKGEDFDSVYLVQSINNAKQMITFVNRSGGTLKLSIGDLQYKVKMYILTQEEQVDTDNPDEPEDDFLKGVDF